MSVHFDKLKGITEKNQNEMSTNEALQKNRNYYLVRRPYITLLMTFGFSLSLVGFFAHRFVSVPEWWSALYWVIGLFGIVLMTTFLIIVIRNDRKLKITKEIIAQFKENRRKR